jgi:hypothetical protein
VTPGHEQTAAELEPAALNCVDRVGRHVVLAGRPCQIYVDFERDVLTAGKTGFTQDSIDFVSRPDMEARALGLRRLPLVDDDVLLELMTEFVKIEDAVLLESG